MSQFPKGLLILLLECLVASAPLGARAQSTRYVFKPGSRQAVAVPAGQTGTTGHPGTRYRRGGMSLNRQYSGSTSTGRQSATRARSSAAGTGHSRQSTAHSQTRSSTAGTGYSRQSTAHSRKGSSAASPGRSRSFSGSVACNGVKRTFHVYVPPGYRSSTPIPVMLVFHGLKMNCESMTAITGFNGIARRERFVVVYCQALNGRFDDGMNPQAGVDDVQYVEKILSQLSRQISIDAHRVYAVGLSNGGYFVQLLACSLPDRIAAVAVVGATAMQQALSRLSKDRPVPVIFFAGSKDPLVNWGDSKTRDLGKYSKKVGMKSFDPAFYALARYGGWLTVQDAVDFWVKHNGCHGDPRSAYLPDRERDGMRVKKDDYGSGNREVALYTIEGGTHSWPGALYIPGLIPKTCQDISASEEIWRFFKHKSR